MKYGEHLGWKFEVMTAEDSGTGGFSKIEFLISGDRVYSQMKYEWDDTGRNRIMFQLQTALDCLPNPKSRLPVIDSSDFSFENPYLLIGDLIEGSSLIVRLTDEADFEIGSFYIMYLQDWVLLRFPLQN